jgi:hypothetical protein
MKSPKITPAMRRTFRGDETPKEEAAERKLVPNKAKYKAVEAKLEPSMHKKRKFAEGGMGGEMTESPTPMTGEPAYGDREGDSPGANLTVPTRGVSTPPPAAKEQSFGAAFAAAKADGRKTFPWKGKTYTTEMAGGPASRPMKPAAPKTDRPRGDGGEGGRASTPAQETMGRRIAKQDSNEMPIVGLARKAKELLAAPGRRMEENLIRSQTERAAEAKRSREDNDTRKRESRGYAAGGMVSSRGNGCAQRGLTKGRMV